MKNRGWKKQMMIEKWNEYNSHSEREEDKISLREYTEHEAESDPGFFRWLLDDENLEDFDFSITDEQKQEYNDFLNEL